MDQYAPLGAAGASTDDSFLSGCQKRVRPRRRFWLEFTVADGAGDGDRDSNRESDRVFHPFGRLPTELRIQIWTLAACTPRIVAIACRSADVLPRQPGTPAWRPPPAPLPVLMRVSREAYDVGRRVYSRAFRWKVPYTLLDDDDDDADEDEDETAGTPIGRGRGRGRGGRPRPRPGGAGCWFNFASDAVLLCGEMEPLQEAASTSMAYFLPQADTARVRLVAFDERDMGVGDVFAAQLHARLFPIVDRFDVRNEIVVVVPEGSGQASARKTLTEASLLTADGDGDGALNRDVRDLSSDDARDNVCQQVWDRWTNSQHMPQLGVPGRRAVAQNTPSSATGVASRLGPDPCATTVRFCRVVEKDLPTAIKHFRSRI